MEILTREEARLLAATRTLLLDICDRCLRSWDNDSAPNDVFSFGKLSEAADVAENAIFNTLNTASSHLGDVMAKEFIGYRQVSPAEFLATGMDTPFGPARTEAEILADPPAES